jgi:glutamate dehydrogenase (NADP+)
MLYFAQPKTITQLEIKMSIKNEYLQKVYEKVVLKNKGEDEFHQAVREFLESLEPVLEKNPSIARTGVIDRIVEPERQIYFRVSWVDDAGNVQVNRGYRISSILLLVPTRGVFACILQ